MDELFSGPRSPARGFQPSSPARGFETVRFSGSAWQSGALTRWLGTLSTRTAVIVLIAGTLLGIIASVALGQEPGNLLGFFVIMGSVAAACGITRGKAYLLFPMPALAFFVAAIVVGKIHDAKLGSSTASLGVGLTQWVAGMFFPAVVATILVLLIGGGRWMLGRQLVTGQSLVSPGGPARPSPPRGSPRMAAAARPAPSSRRPARSDFGRDDFDLVDAGRNQADRGDSADGDANRDDWMDDKPFEDQVFKTEMFPAVKESPGKPDRPARPGSPARSSVIGDGSQRPGRTSVVGGDQRPARPPRDREGRDNRDQRGDPRRPSDRGQPGRTGGPRPSPQPREGGNPRPNAQPREGGSPRPSFKPNQPGQQPQQRRQPPEGWNQR